MPRIRGGAHYTKGSALPQYLAGREPEPWCLRCRTKRWVGGRCSSCYAVAVYWPRRLAS